MSLRSGKSTFPGRQGPRAGRQRVRQSHGGGSTPSRDPPIEVREAWELQNRLADGLLVFRGLFNLAGCESDEDCLGFRPPDHPGGPFEAVGPRWDGVKDQRGPDRKGRLPRRSVWPKSATRVDDKVRRKDI